jgi:hypothetical protein
MTKPLGQIAQTMSGSKSSSFSTQGAGSGHWTRLQSKMVNLKKAAAQGFNRASLEVQALLMAT